MKPLYDRYRLVKQILCRASTIPVIVSVSLSLSTFQQLLCHTSVQATADVLIPAHSGLCRPLWEPVGLRPHRCAVRLLKSLGPDLVCAGSSVHEKSSEVAQIVHIRG